MIPVFSNITNSGFLLLKNIIENPECTPGDFFFDDPTVDGQLELLINSKLVSLNSDSKLSVTELGRAALKEYYELLDRNAEIQKQQKDFMDSIKEIANAAAQQAQLAQDDAKSSKQDSRFAKITSAIAIIISIIAIIVDLLC